MWSGIQSRIWTRVAVSNSYDDNHYTMGTSNITLYTYIYIYICVCVCVCVCFMEVYVRTFSCNIDIST